MFGLGDGRTTTAQHVGGGLAPRIPPRQRISGGLGDPTPGCAWLHALPCTSAVDVGGRFSPPRSKGFGRPADQPLIRSHPFPITVSHGAEPLTAPRVVGVYVPGPACGDRSCWMPVACSGTGAWAPVCGGNHHEILESDDRHPSDDDSDAEVLFARRKPPRDLGPGADLSHKPREQCCASQRSCNGNVGDCMDNLLDVDQGEQSVDMRSAARISQRDNSFVRREP